MVSLGDLGNMTGLHELNARRNEIGDLARRGGARGDLVDPRIFPEPRLPPNLRRIFLSHNKIAAACHVAPLRDLGYLEELALDGCPVDARPGYRTDVVDAVSPAVRVLDGAPVTELASTADEPLQQLLAEMIADRSAGLQERNGGAFSALIQRFPLLRNHPPEDFVEAVFLHFLDVLELRTLENELEMEMAASEAELDENAWNRIRAVTQDLSRRREECVREEAELAERAKKIKATPMPVPEAVSVAARA